MEKNVYSTFLVLKIQEFKSNGKTEITVDKGFDLWLMLKNIKMQGT